MRRLLGIVVAVLMLAGMLRADQPDIPINVGLFPQEKRTFYTAEQGLPSDDVRRVSVEKDGTVYVRTAKGDFRLEADEWHPSHNAEAVFRRKQQLPSAIGELPEQAGKVLSVANGKAGEVAIGAEWGLFLKGPEGIRAVFPQQGNRRWGSH